MSVAPSPSQADAAAARVLGAAPHTLGKEAFHGLLRGACLHGLESPAVVAEAARRAERGDLGVPELRLVLLVAPRSPQWEVARAAALTAVARRLELAPSVLAMHAQVEMWPPVQLVERCDGGPGGAFVAQASLGPADRVQSGAAQAGSSKKQARQRAMLSLLAKLVGLPDPVTATAAPARDTGGAAEPEPEAGLDPASAVPMVSGRLGAEVFQVLLDSQLGDQVPGLELVDEIRARAGADQLKVPQLQALLFATDLVGWRAVRGWALEQVARVPGTAAAVLSRQAQLAQTAPLAYQEAEAGTAGEPGFVCVGSFDPGGGLVRGPDHVGRSKKSARNRAAVALLAQLAGLPCPEVADLPAAASTAVGSWLVSGSQNVFGVLNKAVQTGAITRLEYSFTSQGKLFACEARCEVAGRLVEGRGRGRSKTDARSSAARDLLGALRRAEQSAEVDGRAEGAPQPAQPASGAALEAAGGAAGAGSGASGAGVPVPRTAQPPTSAVIQTRPVFPIPVPPVSRPALSAPASAGLRPERADGPGGAGAWFEAAVQLRQVLADGMAAVFVPAEHPVDATFLLYRSDGGRLEPAAPAFPLRAAVRELVLPAEAGPVPRRVSAECWEVPVGLVLPLLAVPPHGAHPAVVGWARAARLALRLVTQKRVYPAVSEAGVDCWRIGPVTGALQRAVAEVAAALPPHAHCLLAGTSPYRITAPEVAVWSFLDAVAEAMVRTPGASALVGDAPYAAARPRSAPGLWPWADALEETWDAHRAPGMVLRIKNPDEAGGTGAEPVVPAALHLLADDGGQSAAAAALWDGTSCAPGLSAALLPAVRRTLRRAAASFTPLARLAAQKVPVRLELTGAELLHLHSGADRQLAEHGIAVDWPAGLLDALDAYAVLGTAGGDEASAAGGGRRVRGRLGLEELVDCRWQLTVDGQPLTEQEMDALAQAVLPLVRLRERWILLDSAMAKRARHRRLAPLPGAQALAAALSGHAPLDGTLVACRPAGALADLADSLRTPPETCTLVPPPTALNARLRAYQERALAWLARTTDLGFGALLADDMGLGKTLTVIALHLHRQQVGQAGPTLVVCPASLMANWERELARFAPATPVRRYHGPGRTLDDLPDGTVVITTYGTGRRDTDQLASLPWGLTVADEAQHIKNPAAATTQAMRSLRGTANVAVTGTPVENSLTDLWALLDWANPGLFGPLAAFRARYGRIERDPDHAAAGELARLLGPFMLRRRKSDPGIAPELPDKVHHQRIVTLTREQAGLYQALVDQTLEQVKASTGIARRGLVLKLLQCLRQICNTPAHYLKEPADQAAADPKAAAARSGKLAALDDLLTSLTARGEAALIFTSYVRMGHLLKAYLRGRGRTPYFLHGATPAGRRQELVDAFQHDANPAPVFILSVKAAGFGLNLIRAEHVIHYDRPWNPAVEDQATDRAHRIGQHRTVNVHHLTTEGTVEDHITALLERKRALGQAVLTSGETALAELDDAELAALVTLAGTR